MRMRQRLWLPAALPVFWAICLAATAPSAEDSFVPAPVSMRNTIIFNAGHKPAAVYQFGNDLAKPIFWPLLSPNDNEITRAWPLRTGIRGESTDHKHQKSAWFTYGDVIPEGMEITHKRKGVEGIDFWAEEPGCGKIVCVGVSNFQQGKNQTGATTANEWRTPDGVKIMDEVRTINFFNFENARLIVVDIDLHASVVPITFGDTKEGAFGVRVAHSLREDRGKGRITNAEAAVGAKQCWGRISAWCDYSGPVAGETAGIAIFAGPDNPLPSCWHSRAYGLMAANPFGRAKSGFPDMKGKNDRIRLAKGEHLKLRYGIFIHQGDVKQGRVAEAYELFKKIDMTP